jgi:WD40 repeat protein
MTRGRRRSWARAAVLALALIGSTAAPASAAGGTALWASRYDSAANKADTPSSLAVSPDGSTVFVTGASQRWPSPAFATVAYDAVSGDTVWEQTYRGAGSGARANEIAISPDGSIVIVAGETESSTTGRDVGIVAYDAATGASLWSRRYDEGGAESAFSIAVDPVSRRFFITGDASNATGGVQVVTIAYDYGATAATRRWVRRYQGPAGGDDVGYRVGVSPDGSGVFVSGDSYGGGSGFDYLTIGYDAASGSRRWVRTYNGPAGGDESSGGLSVSGSTVFVTGASPRADGTDDYATVAYAAASGARQWARRYDGPGHSYDLASGVQSSPDGAIAFVTGQSIGASGDYDYGTIAYDAATGSPIWVSRYDGGPSDEAKAIDVSPDGTSVVVTGASAGSATQFDFATVAYSASGGTTRWTRRYDGPASGVDQAVAIGVGSSEVFVTGPSWDAQMLDDYATVAYTAT